VLLSKVAFLNAIAMVLSSYATVAALTGIAKLELVCMHA
jgi:hypothetical protein